ncbi:hypothetical protein, partial [Bradyrhizobium sp.]|uniref:hypothetical protein n=1 Tax=Bradyrhizobium sp. TaxID=376 RepID=UPI0025BB03BB
AEADDGNCCRSSRTCSVCPSHACHDPLVAHFAPHHRMIAAEKACKSRWQMRCNFSQTLA